MIRMINAQFGNEMWVAEDRAEEYLAAGHRPAADADQPAAQKTPKKAAKKKPAK